MDDAALSGQPGCIPPVVVAGGSLSGGSVSSVLLCGPSLLGLTGRAARIVAVQHGVVLLDVMISGGSDAMGCLRFQLPLSDVLLGIVDVYVLPQEAAADRAPPPWAGGRARLPQKAQLLALPPDAAAEVSGLFGSMTRQVEEFLRAPAFQGPGQASPAAQSGPTPGAAAPAPGPGPSVDLAACWAYAHFFAPFLQSWAALSRPAGAAGGPGALDGYRRMVCYLLDRDMYSCVALLMAMHPGLAREAAARGLELSAPRREVAQAGEAAAPLPGQVDGGGGGAGGHTRYGASSVGMWRVRDGHDERRSPNCTDQQEQQQRDVQRQEWEQQQQAWAQVHPDEQRRLERQLLQQQLLREQPPPVRSEASSVAMAAGPLPPGLMVPPRSSSADEEMRVLNAQSTGELMLTRVRGPLAAGGGSGGGGGTGAFTKGGLLSASREAPPSPGTGTGASLRRRRAQQQHDLGSGEQQQQLQQQRLRREQRGPEPLGPFHELSACSGGSASDSGSWLQLQRRTPGAPAGPGAPPPPPFALLRALLLGFPLRREEASYGRFKANACSPVDLIALVYSLLASLVCLAKSLGSAPQAACILSCLGCYIFPYAIMLAAPAAWLRHREALIAAARCAASAAVACIMLWVPAARPAGWVVALERTWALHASHAFITPVCQQVRGGYLLIITPFQFFNDFALLSMAMPPARAAASSAKMQACAAAVTLLLDCCMRRAFLENRRAAAAAAASGAGLTEAPPPPGLVTAQAPRDRRRVNAE